MLNRILQRLKYQSSFKDKIKFWKIILLELLCYPILITNEELKKYLSYLPFKENSLNRIPVDSNEVLICIHEWAGYNSTRSKKIGKKIKEFECGLNYQLLRFQNYCGTHKLDITLTISEREKYNYKIPDRINTIDVSNEGYDFAGYAEFYKRKLYDNSKNQYVILTNTSVEKSIDPFLDDYIRILEKDQTIGLLGISYNTKLYQTLIHNNFNPHLESFFLITTSDILKKVVKKNHGNFPGNGISHKLLLIRNGEFKLSKIVLNLGYKLAFVLNDGKLYSFKKRNSFDNGYASWKLPKGDYRLFCETPNKINPTVNKYDQD